MNNPLLPNTLIVFLILLEISDHFGLLQVEGVNAPNTRSRCYSCASENMKDNFLSRSRGPKKRKEEPKLYDNLCDLDTWMIREKSAVDCDGSCFKWQQVLNNSGVYSYATIRGCYNKMFDLSNPQTEPERSLNECMARQLPFDCVDQSSLMEWQCFCQGDYCNPANRPLSATLFVTIATALLILFVW